MTLVDDWAGTGGIAPDTRPVIDDLPVNGMIAATGFRARFIFPPIAAQVVRSLGTGENCPLNADLFAIDRFQGGSWAIRTG